MAGFFVAYMKRGYLILCVILWQWVKLLIDFAAIYSTRGYFRVKMKPPTCRWTSFEAISIKRFYLVFLGTAKTRGLCWTQLFLFGGESNRRREKRSLGHWLNPNQSISVYSCWPDEDGGNYSREALWKSKSNNSLSVSTTLSFHPIWQPEWW